MKKEMKGLCEQADGVKTYTYRITDHKIIKDIMNALASDKSYGRLPIGGLHERFERFQETICTNLVPQSIDEAFLLTQALINYDTNVIYIQAFKPHYNEKIKSSVAVNYIDIDFTYFGDETLLDFELIPRYVGMEDEDKTKVDEPIDVSVLVGFDLNVIESEYENNEEVEENADCE